MMTWDGIMGLGEMMSFPNVLSADENIHGELAETLKADYKPGDLNGDGNCSVIDLLIMRRILFGTLEPDQSQLRSSDYNSDGYINILDQQRLLADML